MRFRTSLTIALLTLVACGDGLPVSTGFVLTLRAARARWQSSGIVSYELTVRRICYCGFVEPVRVKVENRVVVSRTVASTGEPLSAVYAELYPDVPGLFAIVERAASDADDLDTTFDATYGFPSKISIDWDEIMVDDEVIYRTEAFTITP
jgi:hypothetical protein